MLIVSYYFPPELDRLVREELATGIYRSEDDLLLEAIQALRDRDEAIVGLQEGIADMNAGRVLSLDAMDAELRKKYNIPHDA
jgi:Arc/MetJ-type ribon-helix-helix transcriptional regulator